MVFRSMGWGWLAHVGCSPAEVARVAGAAGRAWISTLLMARAVIQKYEKRRAAQQLFFTRVLEPNRYRFSNFVAIYLP